MAYLIGTDEAGYGPNVGPLVISATVWEVPEGLGGEDLFDHVGHLITPRPDCVDDARGPWVAMADSKKLYTSGNGLRHLERGLWAAFGLLDHCPRNWRDVWRCLAPEALDPMRAIPWYAGYDAPAPTDCNTGDCPDFCVSKNGTVPFAASSLRTGLAEAGVRLVAVQSRAIFAEQFNDLVEKYGSKGEALSHQTLDLASRAIQSLPPTPVSVVCDKHGGRNRYGAPLADHFPDHFIEVRGEGRQRSLYRFGPPDARVEFCFRTKAESCLPAALASMASKYLREMAMQAFNDFWQRHVAGLRPTAGYPQDAKRFRADVAEAKRHLNIADRIFWRVK